MFPTASRANAQQVELDGLIRHRVIVSDIDIAMMRKVERFILRYVGDDLLHDIELKIPAVFVSRVFSRPSTGADT